LLIGYCRNEAQEVMPVSQNHDSSDGTAKNNF